MPLFDVNIIEGAVTPEEKTKIIERITDLSVEIWGEPVRRMTWIRFVETPKGDWAIGGKPFEVRRASPEGEGAAAPDKSGS